MDPWRIFGVEEIFFFWGLQKINCQALEDWEIVLGVGLILFFYQGFVDVLGVVLLSTKHHLRGTLQNNFPTIVKQI